MAFHHRLESIQAREVLVVVVRAQQLVKFPNLFQGLLLQFHTVVAQKLVEARKGGRHALAAKQREIRTRRLQVWHEISTGGSTRTVGHAVPRIFGPA